MEAMKMEPRHQAEVSGTVQGLRVRQVRRSSPGPRTVIEGNVCRSEQQAEAAEVDLDRRRRIWRSPARHAIGLGRFRPDAVRTRKTGQRTTRENIDDLCDPGTFIEYGPLVIAAQRRRRPVEELIEKTPADGMVAGIGSVNGGLFDESKARAILMSYDYTVLAGTQGTQNHRKKDRMFELAEKHRLPVVFFTDGGGGRPGDTAGVGGAGLDCMAFNYFGKLSGLVPLVGITSGRCFAGKRSPPRIVL